MDDKLIEKIAKDTEKGINSEKLFAELMKNDGYIVYYADKYQNMYEHWDIAAVKSDEFFVRFDVKSKKESTDNGYAWIELLNVNGDDGWIKSPYYDAIAFEKDDCFELVTRSMLLTFIEYKLKEIDEKEGFGIYYTKEILKPYQRYRRSGRNDIVIKVPFEDFKGLIYKKVYKI